MAEKNHIEVDGQKLFEEDWAKAMSDPRFRAIYEAEARKKELWLQLVEARQAAGLTQKEVAERLGVSQAQVARIEKRGYESYTLRTLQRYLQALGNQFTLAISVKRIEPSNSQS